MESLELRLLLTGVPLEDVPEISGAIWQDFNGDGTRDIEDTGVAGRIVFLDDNGDGQLGFSEQHTRTNSQGQFEFSGLEAGPRIITQITPDGWQPTYPDSSSYLVYATPGSGGELVEFGTQRVWGTVLGVVWEDLNGNGQQDEDESGVSGWPVFLDANNNGEFDNGEKASVSSEHGHFQFPDLEPGDYTISLYERVGWQPTSPSSGELSISLAKGELLTGLSLSVEPVWGIIEGTVWYDDNQDGQSLGEPGLADWQVFLDGNSNGEFDEGEFNTRTGDNGQYRFLELDEGTYQVGVVVPDDWELTSPADSPTSTEIEVEKGQIAAGQRFGADRALGAIVGLVWHDADYSANQEAGEVGLANWVVFLDGNENGALDEGETHTESDADGSYKFDSLTAGAYHVVQVLADGWQATVVNFGAQLVELARGQIVKDIDFSNDRLYGSIKGLVWHDRDYDATRAEEEAPLAGIVVFIDDNANGKLDEGERKSLTGQRGEYGFADLEPGTYTVLQDLQKPWKQSYPRNSSHVVQVGYEIVDKVDFGDHTFTNPHAPLDVNGDGQVTPRDLLYIINELNDNGSRGLTAEGEGAANVSLYVDTNGDGLITPVDALNVINYLNQYGGVGSEASESEPEGEAPANPTPADNDVGQLESGSRSTIAVLSPFGNSSDVTVFHRQTLKPSTAAVSDAVFYESVGDQRVWIAVPIPAVERAAPTDSEDVDQALDEFIDELRAGE